MNKPKKYNMEKEEDVKRWFKKMEGYLKTGYGENKTFINMGTDFKGRALAMDGFRQLRVLLYKHFEELNKEVKI